MIEEHWGNASLSALVARMLYEVFAFKHMVFVSHKAKRSPQIAMISKQPWQLSSSEIMETSILKDDTCLNLDA